MLFFRACNLLVIVVVLFLTLGLLALRRGPGLPSTRAASVGWWVVLAGHVLLIAGSDPAVALGGRAAALLMGAQDVGFLGALPAALGGVPLGVSGLRRRCEPRAAWALLASALPSGSCSARSSQSPVCPRTSWACRSPSCTGGLGRAGNGPARSRLTGRRGCCQRLASPTAKPEEDT